MKWILLAALLAAPYLLFSCSKSNNSTSPGGNPGGSGLDCSTVPKTFSADVNPTIQATCATSSSCHGAGSSNGPGALTSYSAIFAARVNIRTAVAAGTMPKTGTLTTAEKNAILCWVDAGAPNN
ncbi:MAG TPA: hypothetical protein VG870_11155 [Chitinophagaceae bacterium]|nr:hypothetical protein [Chitinophagaceae bacterium]